MFFVDMVAGTYRTELIFTLQSENYHLRHLVLPRCAAANHICQFAKILVALR